MLYLHLVLKVKYVKDSIDANIVYFEVRHKTCCIEIK